jgi:hypothetical protein
VEKDRASSVHLKSLYTLANEIIEMNRVTIPSKASNESEVTIFYGKTTELFDYCKMLSILTL